MSKLYDLDKEYAQNPNIKREDVLALMEWNKTQPHLPVITEHEALIFYHACGCDMKYTQKVLDLYFTFRTENDDIFGDFDIESPRMQNAQKTLGCFPLENKTPEGHAVLVAKLNDTDPSSFDFLSGMKIACMSTVWLQETGLVSGFQIVVDIKGATMGHVMRTNLFLLRKAIFFLKEALPSRVVGLHFINPNPVIDKILSLITKLVPTEFTKLMHTHKKIESLHKYIPCNILPEEYGGMELDTFSLSENYYQKLRANRLEIIEYNNFAKVNEKLRPSKTKNDGFVGFFV